MKKKLTLEQAIEKMEDAFGVYLARIIVYCDESGHVEGRATKREIARASQDERENIFDFGTLSDFIAEVERRLAAKNG